jgi:hypothetical protein
VSARLEAAAKAIADTYGADNATDSTARAALAAADKIMFSPANVAEIVATTGLSIQTVTEVIRTLERNPR